MTHVFQILVSILNVKDSAGKTRFDFWRFGLNIVQLSALVVCVIAFSQSTNAQEFEDCRPGFEPAAGNVCKQKCPPGFTRNDDFTCKKPPSYSVQSFSKVYGDDGNNYKNMTALENCESRSAEEQIYGYDNQGPKQRCYMSGDFALPRCVPGYHSISVGVCSRNCPPGFQDVGEGCLDNQRYGQTPKAAPEPPAPDLTGWTVCAAEGGRCQFEGTAEVRYGVGNKWNIQAVTNGVDCNNAVFTDPAPGLAKQCLLSPVIVPNAPPDVNTRDASGNNQLHLAVSQNNLNEVNDLLNRGIDVNAGNNSGETPVTIAVEFGYTQIVMALLARGDDLNAAVGRIVRKGNEQMLQTVAGNYPIRMTNEMFDQAVSVGANGIALMSLKYGVDPNRAMGHGIYSRNMQMIDAALAAGANPDTALIFAIDNRMPELISRSLVQYKATPQVAMDLAIPINDAQTLALALDRGADPSKGLPIAIKAGNVAIVETLLSKNANASSGLPDAFKSNNDRIIDLLVEKGADVNTTLQYAVEFQKVGLVSRLLAKGADSRNKFLMYSAGTGGNIEIIKLLVWNGADPNAALNNAVGNRHFEVVEFLLNNGANAAASPETIEAAVTINDLRMVDLLIQRGADPTKGMLVAVQSGRAQILQLLIDNKADVSSPVLITVAAKKGNLGIVSMLLKAGADPENGMSAAVTGGFADIVEMLIEKGADAKKPEYILHAVKMGNRNLANPLLLNGAPKDVIDETGQPLIIIAALRWDTLLVQLLLKNGVDPNAKNRAGDTALHIVANDEASKGYPKFEKMKNARLPMVQALVDGGADVNAINAKGETVLKSLGGGDGDVKKIIIAAGAVKKLGEQ